MADTPSQLWHLVIESRRSDNDLKEFSLVMAKDLYDSVMKSQITVPLYSQKASRMRSSMEAGAGQGVGVGWGGTGVIRYHFGVCLENSWNLGPVSL